jgi:hypothetical protein
MATWHIPHYRRDNDQYNKYLTHYMFLKQAKHNDTFSLTEFWKAVSKFTFTNDSKDDAPDTTDHDEHDTNDSPHE